MPGLPKSYIKKYGVSKKAWREYRKSKAGRSRKSPTRKRSSTTRRRSTMARKKKSYRRSSSRKAPKMQDFLIGGFGATLGEQLIDRLSANMNINVSDDVIKFGVGVFFARRPGMIGEASRALAYIAGSRLLGNLNLGGVLGGSNNAGSNDGW